jgi:hypothetical protein
MTSKSGQPNTNDAVHIHTTLTKAEYVTLLLLCFYALLDTHQTDKEMHTSFTDTARRVFGQMEPATGPFPAFMIIDLTLTQNEYERFLLLCGWGCGSAGKMAGPKGLWQSVHVVNQIFGAMPNFEKYKIPERFRWHESQ